MIEINGKNYTLDSNKYTVEEVRQKAFFSQMGVEFPTCPYSVEELIEEYENVMNKKSSLSSLKRKGVVMWINERFTEV